MLDNDTYGLRLRERMLIKDQEKRFRKDHNSGTVQNDYKMRELSMFFLKRMKEKAETNKSMKDQFS